MRVAVEVVGRRQRFSSHSTAPLPCACRRDPIPIQEESAQRPCQLDCPSLLAVHGHCDRHVAVTTGTGEPQRCLTPGCSRAPCTLPLHAHADQRLEPPRRGRDAATAGGRQRQPVTERRPSPPAPHPFCCANIGGLCVPGQLRICADVSKKKEEEYSKNDFITKQPKIGIYSSSKKKGLLSAVSNRKKGTVVSTSWCAFSSCSLLPYLRL